MSDLPALDNLIGDGFTAHAVVRLVTAALCGGIIGLEREVKGRPAGLKTNIFICVGSALFTLVSMAIAMDYGGDPARIASNIVQGVGFLGAGTVLHARGSVSGLTTAAGIWVMAAVGTTAGVGHYRLAFFSTAMLLATLLVFGYIEKHFSLRAFAKTFEVKGADTQKMLEKIDNVLTLLYHPLSHYEVSQLGQSSRVLFTLVAKRQVQDRIERELRNSGEFTSVLCFPPEVE